EGVAGGVAGRGKCPGRPTDRRWTYRHRHIPMTEETLHKLDALVERVNQHAEKRMNRTQVAAILLEQAGTRELGGGRPSAMEGVKRNLTCSVENLESLARPGLSNAA